MGDTTAIAWADHTFNPWWGCTKISPACDHCYAERDARRWGFNVWGHDTPRRLLSDNNWARPRVWDRNAAEAGHPALVFCASMADVFEPRSDLDPERARLWDLLEETPNLIWLLLTKRPEQVRRLVPQGWLHGTWPANAWVGTTAEDQEHLRIRLPRLRHIPAPVRFLSMEPLLEPVDLSADLGVRWDADDSEWFPDGPKTDHGIGWVIVGGESGPRHRPMEMRWANELHDQCEAAGVPFFFKQVGGLRPSDGGDALVRDGVRHVVKQFPTAARRPATPVEVR